MAWEADILGWVMMNERDLRRIEVFTEVLSGQRTIASAAVILSVIGRQINRLLRKFRKDQQNLRLRQFTMSRTTLP